MIPSQYLKEYSFKYFLKDRATWLIKNYFWKVNTSLKNTAAKADFVWCMNDAVPSKLHLKQDQYQIIPSVATQDFGFIEDSQNENFTFISAGRLVPLKGFDLAIRAFTSFYNSLSDIEKAKTKLIIVGSGPEEKLLIKLARDLGVENNIQFVLWMERNELMKLFKQSQVFLFPSHEGAGMVVPEALSFGLPVICLDNCGPGSFINEQCGIKIKEDTYDNTTSNLAEAMRTLYSDKAKYKGLRKGARAQFEHVFHWDRRGEQLAKIYDSL